MSMLENLRNVVNVWDPYCLVCIILLVVCFVVPFLELTPPDPGRMGIPTACAAPLVQLMGGLQDPQTCPGDAQSVFPAA